MLISIIKKSLKKKKILVNKKTCLKKYIYKRIKLNILDQKFVKKLSFDKFLIHKKILNFFQLESLWSKHYL